jgi:hypothetical protein
MERLDGSGVETTDVRVSAEGYGWSVFTITPRKGSPRET